MANKSASVTSATGIRPGQLWRSTQRKHRGWIVRILSTTDASVAFECVAGPGRSRGKRRRFGQAAFLTAFRRARD